MQADSRRIVDSKSLCREKSISGIALGMKLHQMAQTPPNSARRLEVPPRGQYASRLSFSHDPLLLIGDTALQMPNELQTISDKEA